MSKEKRVLVKKDEVIGAVAEKTGLSKKDVKAVLEQHAEVIKDALVDGKDIVLIGLGKMEIAEMAERTVQVKPGDKSKGTKINPAYKTPRLNKSGELSDLLK